MGVAGRSDGPPTAEVRRAEAALRAAQAPGAGAGDLQALRDALPVLGRAARQDPRGLLLCAEARLVLGAHAGEQRRYAEAVSLSRSAVDLLKRLTPRDPARNPPAAVRLARGYGDLGLWEARAGRGGVRPVVKAVRIWRRLHTADPGNPDHLVGLGQSHLLLASRLLDQGNGPKAYAAAQDASDWYGRVPAEQLPDHARREIADVERLLSQRDRLLGNAPPP
ncbi:hypothetical protein ACIQGZ_26615 [Streptomyces sp. NPDC092296]|uniref:hypothetical protein n=1 Tax=Streptomyces sp. NPDC092296 TaxID=3366012 RepID=UPI00382E8476